MNDTELVRRPGSLGNIRSLRNGSRIERLAIGKLWCLGTETATQRHDRGRRVGVFSVDCSGSGSQMTPDLVLIIEAWPTLSEAVKAEVLSIIKVPE